MQSSINEIRTKMGLSVSQFASLLNIPFKTVQNWDLGYRQCPDYVLELITYYLKNEGLLKQ